MWILASVMYVCRYLLSPSPHTTVSGLGELCIKKRVKDVDFKTTVFKATLADQVKIKVYDL